MRWLDEVLLGGCVGSCEEVTLVMGGGCQSSWEVVLGHDGHWVM